MQICTIIFARKGHSTRRPSMCVCLHASVCAQHLFFPAAVLLASPSHSTCSPAPSSPSAPPTLVLSSILCHLDSGRSRLPALPQALQFTAHKGGLKEIPGGDTQNLKKLLLPPLRLPAMSQLSPSDHGRDLS